MSETLSNQPVNQSFLSPLGFRMQIKKTPTVNYFVQKINIPSISLGTADLQNPFTKIPFPGTRLTYGNLDVTFKVDENMVNYLELYDWITGLGFPESFQSYAELASRSQISGEGLFSDISLIVTTGGMNPNMEISFKDCFPVDLSEIQLDSTAVDVEYVTATVSFANKSFTVKRLNTT